MKIEGKKSPRGPQRDKKMRNKGKSTAFDAAFLGGSSSCNSITCRRINRISGSSKIHINQLLIDKNSHCVIFRVIDQKLHNATLRAKHANLGWAGIILFGVSANLRF